MFAHPSTNTKKLPLLVEGPTKARGRLKTLEPSCWVIALFEAAMILFDVIVQIVMAAMRHLFPKRLADRSRIRVMTVGRHPFRCLASDLERLPEKARGCVPIALLTQHGVNQIAVAIDGPVEVLPHAFDCDVRLVGMPGSAGVPVALHSPVMCQQRSTACFPLTDSLVRKREAAFEEHVGEVAEAQLVAETPEDDQQHDIGGELKIIVGVPVRSLNWRRPVEHRKVR